MVSVHSLWTWHSFNILAKVPHAQCFGESMFAENDRVSDSLGRRSRICCMLPRTKPRPLRVRRLPVWLKEHPDTHTHTPPRTCFCTHCPLLETCLGIPRITTPYRLKIVGNHCLHAVAHPVGSDSSRKIISVYLTGLSVRGQNIPWGKKRVKSLCKNKVLLLYAS